MSERRRLSEPADVLEKELSGLEFFESNNVKQCDVFDMIGETLIVVPDADDDLVSRNDGKVRVSDVELFAISSVNSKRLERAGFKVLKYVFWSHNDGFQFTCVLLG